MPLPTLPPAVLPSDSPDEFDTKMFAHIAALSPWTDAANILESTVNAKELSATAAAASAALSADVALAGSSFKGAWASLSGALNKPATVTHGGFFWALLNNLANVTTSQPGVTADWEQINKLQGNAVGAVNVLKGADIASAATPNIWAIASGNYFAMTGTANVSGFTAAPLAGAERWFRAAGAFTLVNGANLIVQGGANYTCAVGDTVQVRAHTTTQFIVTIYRADGAPTVREGLVWLATASAGGVASITFTTAINSAFDEYVLSFLGLRSSSLAVLRLRTSADGGATWASAAGDYYALLQYNTTSVAAPAGYSGTSESHIYLNATTVDPNAPNGGLSGEIRMYLPADTAAKKLFRVHTMHLSGATEVNQTTGACYRNSTAAINALQITASSGNLTGLVRLYGIKKS